MQLDGGTFWHLETFRLLRNMTALSGLWHCLSFTQLMLPTGACTARGLYLQKFLAVGVEAYRTVGIGYALSYIASS